MSTLIFTHIFQYKMKSGYMLKSDVPYVMLFSSVESVVPGSTFLAGRGGGKSKRYYFRKNDDGSTTGSMHSRFC